MRRREESRRWDIRGIAKDRLVDLHLIRARDAIVVRLVLRGIRVVVIALDRALLIERAGLEYLPVARETNLVNALEIMKKAGVWVYGAVAGSGVPAWGADLTGPLCLVLGSEGAGLRPLVAQACDVVLTIPMRGKVGSLNVAAAGAVLCYEIARQRGARGKELDLSKSQA